MSKSNFSLKVEKLKKNQYLNNDEHNEHEIGENSKKLYL